MENSKPISHFMAGIIISAVLIIYSTALQFLGYGQDKKLGWLAFLFFTAGLIIFINLYGKAMNYRPGFGDLFTYGFKMTAIITLIMIVYLFAFFAVFPEYKQKMIDNIRQEMENKGSASEEQMDMAVTFFKNKFGLLVGGGALFMYLLVGAIASLIGAGITKKQPVNPIDQLPL